MLYRQSPDNKLLVRDVTVFKPCGTKRRSLKMETVQDHGSPNLSRKPLLDVTKTQAYREIYTQRLRSYGMLFCKEPNAKGSIATESEEDMRKRFERHKKHRSVSDPNIDLIRTLSLRNSAFFNKTQKNRNSVSDTMLQESMQRRAQFGGDFISNFNRSLLDLRNTEIPEEGTSALRLQKRHSLVPNVSRYVEQQWQNSRQRSNTIKRQSSSIYSDSLGSSVFETLGDLNNNISNEDVLRPLPTEQSHRYQRSNHPRLIEAKNRSQKRYASIRSLETDIMKADEFLARVKRQCSTEKRQ